MIGSAAKHQYRQTLSCLSLGMLEEMEKQFIADQSAASKKLDAVRKEMKQRRRQEAAK